MPAPVPWIHAFVDLPEPLLKAGLGFWTAATGWPSGRSWLDHPEFHSIEPPDGDAYLYLQQMTAHRVSTSIWSGLRASRWTMSGHGTPISERWPGNGTAGGK